LDLPNCAPQSWLGKGRYLVEANPAAVLDFLNSIEAARRFRIEHVPASQTLKRTPAVVVRAVLEVVPGTLFFDSVACWRQIATWGRAFLSREQAQQPGSTLVVLKQND